MLYDQMKQKRKVKSLLPQKSYLDGKSLTILLLVLSLVLCLWSVSLVTHSVWAQGFWNPGFVFDDEGFTPWPGGSLVDPDLWGQWQQLEDHYKVIVKYVRNVDWVELSPSKKACGHLQPSYNISSPDITNYTLMDIDQSIISGVCSDSPSEIEVSYRPIHDLNGNGIADEEESLQEVTEFDFNSQVDNRVEVLYGMQFVDPLDLQKIVNNIFMSGSSLYITPNPVIVNPRDSSTDRNIVESGVYSHILWWEDNEIYSNNVTIIAWIWNKVGSWNDNLSILWWGSNQIAENQNHGISDIVVWWDSNVLDSSLWGNAIIWWHSNAILGAKNSFILWWSWNNVWSDENFGNLIVWWLGVTLAGKSNMFVYSNSGDFSPETNNAFYLNMLSGVWINTARFDWLSVGGAVSFGEIDIYAKYCDGDNLWVEWAYSWCLVWCTQTSMNIWWRWEMLDQWNRCAQVCTNNSSRCLYNENIEELEVADHSAQCVIFIPGLSTGNAEPCVSNTALDSYKNVFFETSLIDSEDQCPNGGQNVCYYKCKSGYHLYEYQCKQDCEYQWYDWTVERNIKHGEERVWYETWSVNCSSDDGRWNKTCADYKKTLVCDNGTMKIKNTNNVAQNGYYHTGCEMLWYRCDTGTYSLTLTDIQALGDSVPSNYHDRATVTWTRWIYKVCLDYGGVGQTTCNTWDAHFFFSGCRAGYTRDESAQKCKKMCGDSMNGSTGVFYKTGSVTCTGVCEWQVFTCNDWAWTWIYNKSDYPSKSCSLKAKKCSWFNLSEEIYQTWKDLSYYASCTKYNPDGNAQCITGDTKYKLTGCVEGNHTQNMQWCEPNEQPYSCSKPDNSHYVGGSGPWFKTWSWTRNAWYWVTPNCNWECNSWYRLSSDGRSCEPIPGDCGDQPYTCADSGATMIPRDNNGDGSGAIWTCQNNWCHKCDEETSYVTWNNETLRCDKNEDGKCGTKHYECASWIKNDRNEDPDGWYIWDCLWKGNGENDLWCFECKSGYVENTVGGDMLCRRSHYSCGGIDMLYQCQGENEEWVPGTSTWFDNNGDYEWWCWDTHCRAPNDNPSSTEKVCRDVEYWTCGNMSQQITSVSFRSSNGGGFGVDQQLIVKIMQQHGAQILYATCNYVQSCGNGYCNATSLSDDPYCLEYAESHDDGVLARCDYLYWNPRGYYDGYAWTTYIDSLWAVNFEDSSIEYVGDCPSQPKCWTSIWSCIVWSGSSFNPETNTWECVNKMDERISCKYECDCPIGFVRDGTVCKQYAEYCAQPQTSEYINSMCTVANANSYNWSQRTCCGDVVNPNGSFVSAWPHPDELSKFSCNDGDDDSWRGFYWANNMYVFHFQPHHYTPNNCGVSRTDDDILEQCFQGIQKYPWNSDNWYFIESCDFVYNWNYVGRTTEWCNCKVK